jgi:hypothetical protein
MTNILYPPVLVLTSLTERGLEHVGALFPWYIHQGKVYNAVGLAQLCKAFRPVEWVNNGARLLCRLSREFSQIFFPPVAKNALGRHYSFGDV